MIDQLENGALVAFLERLGEAVWLRAPEGEPLFVNAAFEELFGVTRAEYREDPRAFLRNVLPEDRPSVLAAGREARERRVELEVRLGPEAGQSRSVRARVSPLHDQAGDLVAIFGLAEDVTIELRERQWRERFLRAESEREEALEGEAGLRSILDRITDGFFAVDREWRVLYVNSRFEELLCVSAGAILGRSLFDQFPEFEGSLFHEKYRIAMLEKRTVHVEGYWEPLSTWYEAHAYPSEDGLSIVFRDITKRRELEREAAEAAMRERQRLGAELHDSVGQKLTGAALLTRALAARRAAGEPVDSDELETVSGVLDDLIAETRRISRGLFPAELREESLGAALEGLAGEVEELFNVRCEVRASRRLSLPMEAKLHLFRIAQELITNAVKHGGARQMTVLLGLTGGDVEMAIEHDGSIEPDTEGGGSGVGTRSLAYRARAVGATLESAELENGTVRIACTLPR